MFKILTEIIHTIVSLGGRANVKTERFLRYSASGAFTFIIDFIGLWFLIQYLNIHYVPALSISFLISAYIHYNIVRHWAFKGTKREIFSGYLIFSTISITGLLLTTGIMIIFVEYSNLGVYISRIITAFFIGVWNYNLNLFFNFKTHNTELY